MTTYRSAATEFEKDGSTNDDTTSTPTRTNNTNTHKYLALLLGIGLMVPWNAFVTTAPYFQSRLCSVEQFGIAGNFEAYFAVLFNVCNVLALMVLLVAQRYYSDDANATCCLEEQGNNDDCDVSIGSSGASTIESYEQSWRYQIWNALREGMHYMFCFWQSSSTNKKNKNEQRSSQPVIDQSYFLDDDDDSRDDATTPLEEPLLLPLAGVGKSVPQPSPVASYSYVSLSSSNKGLEHAPALTIRATHDHDPPLSQQSDANTATDVVVVGGAAEDDEDLLTKLTTPSLGAYTGAFFLAALMVFRVSFSGMQFFSLTVALVMICGVTCSIASAGLFNTANLFTTPEDDSVKTIFLAGQSASGLFISIINFISVTGSPPLDDEEEDCLASPPSSDANATSFDAIQEEEECLGYNNINWSAFFTYFVTCATLVACIAGYYTLNRLSITQYHRRRLKQARDSARDHHGADDNLFCGSSSCRSNGSDAITVGTSLTSMSKEEMEASLLEHAMNDEDVNYHALAASEADNSAANGVMNMICLLWRPIAAVFFTYFVTLAIFPVWITKLESVDKCTRSRRIYNDLFQPMMFIVYNGTDVLGKFCAGKLIQKLNDQDSSSNVVVYASLARFLLIPALLLCQASDSVMPLLFDSDFWPVFFMMVFGFSNGCVSALGMMQGPALVSQHHARSGASSGSASAADQEMCSTVMVLVASLGLMCGSVASFGVLKIGTGSW
mmetsp:Transcript_24391/g.37619  ORF Transcript_24391/g.37619 Transcript_24391/m.37619 type:complete len:726 (+) Transcript_24391:143-2320(+)|eukprot:CAMPEP_0196814448 /NCGR_PEP_ID=MMETSP1362-20130617/43223_1 /TAXON_ID=163516 /ORGANISM="Leptocylindrus danicus, Strain CCMP1856" /LENGTH=725 /DNA_ID=CAMNT_0042191057 /DNA_START=86 /DNA_END=2263 /DNA_ORIENTATION=+